MCVVNLLTSGVLKAVNIIGLVFNTLCLRDVDASFFQVRCTGGLPIIQRLLLCSDAN